MGLSPGAKNSRSWRKKFIPTLGRNNNGMGSSKLFPFYCKSVRREIVYRIWGNGSLSRLGDLMSCRKGRLIRFMERNFFFSLSRRSTRIFASLLLGSFHHVPLLKREKKEATTRLLVFTQNVLNSKLFIHRSALIKLRKGKKTKENLFFFLGRYRRCGISVFILHLFVS